jgi:hypothetical protein
MKSKCVSVLIAGFKSAVCEVDQYVSRNSIQRLADMGQGGASIFKREINEVGHTSIMPITNNVLPYVYAARCLGLLCYYLDAGTGFEPVTFRL